MQKVELLPAFMWTCDVCGNDVFERGIVPESINENDYLLREEHDIDQNEEGMWMMAPDKVTCPHCKTEYETQVMN